MNFYKILSLIFSFFITSISSVDTQPVYMEPRYDFTDSEVKCTSTGNTSAVANMDDNPNDLEVVNACEKKLRILKVPASRQEGQEASFQVMWEHCLNTGGQAINPALADMDGDGR